MVNHHKSPVDKESAAAAIAANSAAAGAPVAVSKRESSRNKEEKPVALTNLPQLDKIDYIFKTNDEK